MLFITGRAKAFIVRGKKVGNYLYLRVKCLCALAAPYWCPPARGTGKWRGSRCRRVGRLSEKWRERSDGPIRRRTRATGRSNASTCGPGPCSWRTRRSHWQKSPRICNTHHAHIQISLHLSSLSELLSNKSCPRLTPLSLGTLDGLMTDRPSVWAPEDFTDCCFMTGKLNAEAADSRCWAWARALSVAALRVWVVEKSTRFIVLGFWV